MHNFEDENLSNDDFELEFSDLLSEDEMHSISGKLVAQSSWLWTKAHELAYTLFAASSRLTSKARTWLLTDVSKNTLAQRISSADFEVEIMDLPSDILDSKQNVVSKLV